MLTKLNLLLLGLGLSMSLNAGLLDTGDDFGSDDPFGMTSSNYGADSVWGQMYHRDAHDGLGGFWGPGGQYESDFQMFELMCMCDGMLYLAAENQDYRDYINAVIETDQYEETCNRNPPRNASSHTAEINRHIFIEADGMHLRILELQEVYAPAINWAETWDEYNTNNDCTFDTDGNLINP